MRKKLGLKRRIPHSPVLRYSKIFILTSNNSFSRTLTKIDKATLRATSKFNIPVAEMRRAELVEV